MDVQGSNIGRVSGSDTTVSGLPEEAGGPGDPSCHLLAARPPCSLTMRFLWTRAALHDSALVHGLIKSTSASADWATFKNVREDEKLPRVIATPRGQRCSNCIYISRQQIHADLSRCCAKHRVDNVTANIYLDENVAETLTRYSVYYGQNCTDQIMSHFAESLFDLQ